MRTRKLDTNSRVLLAAVPALFSLVSACTNSECLTDLDCAGSLICMSGTCADPAEVFQREQDRERSREGRVESVGDAPEGFADAETEDSDADDYLVDLALDEGGLESLDMDLHEEEPGGLAESEESSPRITGISANMDGNEIPVNEPLKVEIVLTGTGPLKDIPIEVELFFRGRVVVSAAGTSSVLEVNLGNGDSNVLSNKPLVCDVEPVTGGGYMVGVSGTGQLWQLTPKIDGNGYIEELYMDLGDKFGSTGRLSRFVLEGGAGAGAPGTIYALYVDADEMKSTLVEIRDREVFAVGQVNCKASGITLDSEGLLIGCEDGRVMQSDLNLQQVTQVALVSVSPPEPAVRLEGVLHDHGTTWIADFPARGGIGRVFSLQGDTVKLVDTVQSGVHDIASDQDGTLLVTTQGVSMGRGRIIRLDPVTRASKVLFEGLALDASNGYDGAIQLIIDPVKRYDIETGAGGIAVVNDPDVLSQTGPGPYTLVVAATDPWSGTEFTDTVFFEALY